MKIKTAYLTGPALNWAVASSDGRPRDVRTFQAGYFDYSMYHYSTDWAQGGPLLNQHKISRTIDHSGLWIAYAGYNLNDEQRHMQCDRSELVAGLRCLVALNLGEVVDVPEELL